MDWVGSLPIQRIHMPSVSQVCQYFLSHSGDGCCVHFLLLALAAYSCQEGLCLAGDAGHGSQGVRGEDGNQALVTVSGTQ